MKSRETKCAPQMRGRGWMITIHILSMINLGLIPEEYENPEFLAIALSSLWENSGKNRTCAVVVCESAEGLYHAHMAAYGNTTTLKAVADIFSHSHVEPQLGGKKELVAYLLKTGEHAEKGEKVLYSYGIENIKDNKGARNDIEVIEEMLIKGMTPNEILDTNFAFYKFEKMILSAYIHQRIKEAPRK